MERVERVLVASTNPVKINSVSRGFEKAFHGSDKHFDIQGTVAESGVGSQPRTEDEAYQGAFNRAEVLSQFDADYGVAIEGGIYELRSKLWVCAHVIIKSRDGRIGEGKSSAFVLPEGMAKLIRSGMELGPADDEFFGRSNSKQADGTVGKLTGGVIDRASQYIDAVVFALIPFRNPDLY